MNESPVVVAIVVIMVCLAFFPPTDLTYYEENGTITCKNVSGEIIAKEAPVTIIVEVDDDVSNNVDTYKVYVAPEAYANYSIGDTHIEPICTITDYEYYKEIIDMLLESGILG